MRRSYLILFSVILLHSCKNQEAKIPAYITVTDFKLQTNFSKEGSASSKITTIWVEANNEEIGVFELPVTFPLIADGNTDLVITPGINLNGAQSYRNIYEFYEPFTRTYNISPEQELTISSANATGPVTEYVEDAEILILEDFEGAGTNFQKTLKSEADLLLTSDANEIFKEAGLVEDNKKSGKVVMPNGNSLIEFESIQSYILPQYGSNVYLEVNYKCDVQVTFGVFVNEPGQRIQAPVVTVLPSEEWNKIYINLVTEVSAYPSANNFQIFFGAVNSDANANKTIFIDNLKLVYYP